jgi:potassium efflux system protein
VSVACPSRKLVVLDIVDFALPWGAQFLSRRAHPNKGRGTPGIARLPGYPVGILTNPYGRMNRPCMREEALESWRARVVMSFVLLMLGAAVGSDCLAQAPAPLRTTSPASTASTTTASSAPASAPAIAVTEIAIEAESALSRVRQLESDSRIDDLADSVATELPRLVKDADSGASEVRGVLSKHPSPDTLRTLDEAWVDLQERASSIARELTQRAAQLDSTLGALARLNETWQQTIESATALSAPEEILRRAKAVVEAIAKARTEVLARRAEVLGLQSKAADLTARAAQIREALANAEQHAAGRLFSLDSAPVWSSGFWTISAHALSEDEKQTLGNQLIALKEYATGHATQFVLHALLLLAVIATLYAARPRVRRWSVDEPSLSHAAQVFETPIATGVLTALFVSGWFYHHPPRLLWVAVSALGAIPTVVIVRRIIQPYLRPVLYALVGLYFAERLRTLASPSPAISRLLFLVEMLASVVLLCWALRSFRLDGGARAWLQTPAWKATRVAVWLPLAVIVSAIAVNMAGYTRLADLVGGAMIRSAYIAVVFYALTRIAEGLVLGLLHIPPITLLGMVRRHRSLIAQRLNQWVRWAVALFWAAITLQMLRLLRPLVSETRVALAAPATVGSIAISAEQVIAFLLLIWAAFLISRFLRFALDEEVYPKFHVEHGLPYAISTMLHYTILFCGFMIALAALGVDMTKFTILAGAFGVGLGFGMQNIVSNFVSGLILLFERPIKLGDVVQLDDISGRVLRIGMRASVIRSTNGADVIIPNGKLISEKVINWTLTDRLRRVDVPVVVAATTDPSAVKALLLDVAHRNAQVAATPAPQALFNKVGPESLEFELRVWTDAESGRSGLRSDLISKISEALHQHQIAVR